MPIVVAIHMANPVMMAVIEVIRTCISPLVFDIIYLSGLSATNASLG